jgi:hypothetical protein
MQQKEVHQKGFTMIVLDRLMDRWTGGQWYLAIVYYHGYVVVDDNIKVLEEAEKTIKAWSQI